MLTLSTLVSWWGGGIRLYAFGRHCTSRQAKTGTEVAEAVLFLTSDDSSNMTRERPC